MHPTDRPDARADGGDRHAYRRACDWLFSRDRGGAPRDAARMARLIADAELPIPPATVHVVGTNGKGSVASMIAAGLHAAGRRSGLVTSPHVEDFRERIAVDGEPIAVERVVAEIDRLRHDPRLASYGFFELTLALALSHFAREGVEIATIEAGIGARRDATEAIGRRALSALTNVALDHRELLGDTVEAIAADKLATLRPGVPLVSGATGAAAELAAATAAAVGAPLHLDRADDPLFAEPLGFDNGGADGAARRNRRLAAAALRLLGVDEGSVAAGLAAPPLPARRERFRVRGRTVLLDGAHDPAAAALLRSDAPEPYLLVFGALARKEGAATLAPLAAGAQWTVLTEARAGEGRPAWGDAHPFEADPERALAWALSLCPTEGAVVVAGSLYLAGRVRPFLRQHHRP